MSAETNEFRDRALRRWIQGEITETEYQNQIAKIDELEAKQRQQLAPDSTYRPGDETRGAITLPRQAVPLRPQSGDLVEKYRLESMQRGGMGEVWQAWDTKGERFVALKFLPPELSGNDDEIARIRATFKLVEQLDHPHICRVFDLHEHPRWGWYQVMRWIDGQTLSQYWRSEVGLDQPMPLREVLHFLEPTARALDYAHGKKVLHRDIKPQNIMRDGAGQVSVIDFGLAAEVRSSLTRVSRKDVDVAGTRPYLAPEQWDGTPASPRSDQYALGVTAYELLSGCWPYESDDPAILARLVLTKPVPLIAGLPSHVMSALQRALSKSPGERFDSCREFVRALAAPAVKTTASRSSAPPSSTSPSSTPPSSTASAAVVSSLPRVVQVSNGNAPAWLRSPFSTAEAESAQQAWAKSLGKKVIEKNSLGMELVLIPPGVFRMGSPADEAGQSADIEASLQVTLTEPFWLGRTEVTQGQWESVMGTTPWRGRSYVKEGADYAAKAPLLLFGLLIGRSYVKEGADYAATYVSWDDAQEFCRKLSAREGQTYRLPTEAEWEWSCRAGTTTRFSFGDSDGDLGRYAWYTKNANDIDEKYAHRVGLKPANGFGLSDMHGNVWEWCRDRFVGKLPGGKNPLVTSGGSYRVVRGGGWDSAPAYCRSASRNWFSRDNLYSRLGFRPLAVQSR